MPSIRIPLTPDQESRLAPLFDAVEMEHHQSGRRMAVFGQAYRNDFAGGAHLRIRHIDPDTAAAVAEVMRERGYL